MAKQQRDRSEKIKRPLTNFDPRRAASALLDWYAREKRTLPWRMNRDPYRIWISEVMLQQTTIRAVVPYFEKFMARFPTLESLAQATQEEVYALWSGLGYYSRARNLLLAAQALYKQKQFPKCHLDLLELPGFGPYTARAVSSIAFDEPVGVLDGNVIRVLTRWLALDCEWWRPKERDNLQEIADDLAHSGPSGEINQALMELGATICTPQNPGCLLCPAHSFCLSKETGKWASFPKPRPRREREIWAWETDLVVCESQIALVRNTYAPFLRGQLLCPGKVKRLNAQPKKFHFRHSITHHDIFVTVQTARITNLRKHFDNRAVYEWLPIEQLSSRVPASLIRKVLEHGKL